MPELYLMRHAKARRPRADQADHRRPLRRRGHRQAAAMAPALARWQALEGEILVSGARRCVQTLAAVEAELAGVDLTGPARVSDALYTFEGEALLAWLRGLPAEAERVLLVGHNPALLQLARWLCREAPASLPTAGLLHLHLPGEGFQGASRHGAEWVRQLLPAEASHVLFQRRAPAAPKLGKADLATRLHGLLCHQRRLVRALEPGVIAGIDPEFLHQYRVNLRRSRALGEAFAAVAEVPGLRKRLKRLKRRARATSELRDLDVFLESLAEAPPLPEVSRHALVEWLRARRQERHAALCRQLDEREYAKQMAQWRDFLDGRRFRQALDEVKPRRVEAVLAERTERHDSDLAALSQDSDDTAFHELRKTVKRIRYLAELDPRRHRDLLRRLKKRQTLLGELQDLCTRQAWVEAFARDVPEEAEACRAWVTAIEGDKATLRGEITALAPLAKVDAQAFATKDDRQ
jgi:CHAD domain-containing protein/phosphohistidine phosphatase SixA